MVLPCGVFSEGAGMMEAWRSLACAAALNVIVAGGVATAQTVVVMNAPPGSTIELALNAETIGSAKADPGGQATLSVNLADHGGKTETDARVYVDICASLRRVVLVERGLQPAPPGETCARRELIDLLILRKVTSLVVDVKETNPAVWVRQGPVPPAWLRQGSEEVTAARNAVELPTGFVLFGGGGFTKFRDAVAVACGSMTDCTGDLTGVAYTGGAEFWLTRYLSAEATYLRPAEITATGEGGYYRFHSILDAHIFTFAGKLGIQAGPVRIYGKGGATYHRAVTSMMQTIDDRTVTVGDATVGDTTEETITGGTQVFELQTSGWGWMFGGGLEGWVSPTLALYAEGGYDQIRGADRSIGEGLIRDRVIYAVMGIRVHIGR
jgi:hypothetical protein